MCEIVHETCNAIVSSLLTTYIAFPSGEQLDGVLQNFSTKWGLPQCVGAIDGCHILIAAPLNNHTDYYNRKGFYSMILQGVVDANYRFLTNIDDILYSRQSALPTELPRQLSWLGPNLTSHSTPDEQANHQLSMKEKAGVMKPPMTPNTKPSICMFLNERREGRKKEASKVKQTNKQSITAHPRQSLFLEKMSCFRWDSNPRHSIL